MRITIPAFIILSILIAGCIHEKKQGSGQADSNAGCSSDSDCASAECCHSASCVPKHSAPSCAGILCTMECVPNTLDCGQGACRCIESRCTAAFE